MIISIIDRFRNLIHLDSAIFDKHSVICYNFSGFLILSHKNIHIRGCKGLECLIFYSSTMNYR